ncbi:hypothetical protein GCM10009846_19580 [Agrococcus versicolor]|uniref:Sugar ABC transporter ATPase n=1 Tax=Agrococcus versicolor TaxID=501482 RepID=A0ABN3ATG3_9MICO
MTDETVQDAGDWSDQVAEGVDYDETLGDAAEEPAPSGVDDSEAISAQDVPDGYEDRDEDIADDDPADVPDEHGGAQHSLDTDDDGVDDTVLPEGTDSIVDESSDWE